MKLFENCLYIFIFLLNVLLYFLQPKGDRVYETNGRRFKLSKDTVDKLLYFNKSRGASASENIDRTFVEMLLLSVCSVSDLKQNKIDARLLLVIKGKLNSTHDKLFILNEIKFSNSFFTDFFKIRVGRNNDRFGKFESYINSKCHELQQK